MKYIVKNLQETAMLAKDFAESLKGGEVVLLNGDLGAGKTTFTQFVFKQLGVTDVVTSPTFSILKIYEGKFKLYHFDTYRISTEEAIEAGFDEVFEDKEAVIFVEWSENISSLLPDEIIQINIKHINETSREIEIIYE